MQDRVSLIAKALTHSGALKFGEFRLKSGIMSPYYIDVTWLLSSPEDFQTVVNLAAEEVRSLLNLRRIDKLASVALKGALLIPSIAGKVGLPCIIARKESKSYGLTGRLVGGNIREGERFLFFDDVVSSGASKIEGIRPIEKAGGKIEAILVLVDREQGGKEKLEEQGYEVNPLTTISDLVESLQLLGAMSRNRADMIVEYLKNRPLRM